MSVLSTSESLEVTSTSSPTEEILYGPTGKRLDYISWHQLHMFLARSLAETAENSGNEPGGCYIVDKDHYQLATGYSGEPSSSVCRHAVDIALEKLKSNGKRATGAVLYTTGFPTCAHCAASILEHKIHVLWFWHTAEPEEDVKNRLEPVDCRKYVPTRQISIDFHQK